MYLLHTYPDRFVLDVDGGGQSDGHGGSGSPESLLIDRATGAITRSKGQQRPPHGAAYSERIDGLLGIITLLRGRYLIVMTGSKHVATVQGCPIRQLVDTKIIPFATDKYAVHLTADQEKDETRYLSLLNQVLQCGFFYFSYDYDLTLSTQRIAAIRTDPSANALPLWKRADPRFFWNRYLLTDLIQTGQADEYLIPLMNGYVFQQHQRIKQHDVTFVLISRRSHERTGRRFVTRGLDLEGHAANFAEAEQTIFVTSGDLNSTRVASFLQTRGSIPVLWEQPVTLKYTPKIAFQISGRPIPISVEEAAAGGGPAQQKKFEAATDLACRRHFDAQCRLYGKQVCLNLVNQKGAELALVKAFKHSVDTMARSDVRLINWDFHQETKGMKYENIGRLVDLIREDVDQMGYFCARVSSTPTSASSRAASRTGKVEWEVSKRQSGAIRTSQ